MSLELNPVQCRWTMGEFSIIKRDLLSQAENFNHAVEDNKDILHLADLNQKIHKTIVRLSKAERQERHAR